jgi:hypothetical protein
MKRKVKKGIPKDVSIDDWVEKQTKKNPILLEEPPSISFCDSYDPETTLFISIATHASLLLGSDGMPILTDCHLRNVEKKNVANVGVCSKRFMASPFFVNPEKILQILETDIVSESRQRHLHTLSENKYREEYIKIMDEILFTPETPTHLSASIINHYEKNGCNFEKTFPTISSIEESFSLYLSLKQKIMGRATPFPPELDLRDKFSCNVQKNKPAYWLTVYNLEDKDNIYDSIVFSFVLRGERKFYNIFFKNELYRLFRDIKGTKNTIEQRMHSDSSNSLGDEPIDELIHIIKRQLKPKENKSKKYTYYINIDTHDLFTISKLLQDFCNIEKIFITDFSCKSTENVEKDLEYKDFSLGYGGKHKRKSKKNK